MMSITGDDTTGDRAAGTDPSEHTSIGDGATPRLVRLDAAEAADPEVVGAKAAGLARLVAADFDVPGAIVLSVGVSTLLERGSLGDWLTEVLPDLISEVGQPVAVRSSATWEDSSTSAHAGATVTELDVAGIGEVAASVRRCVVGTIAAQRACDTVGDTAVIIQRMVPAQFAGVAFTADPLSGDRDVVRIAATAGLGEALVQGETVGSDLTVRGSTIEGDPLDLPRERVLELSELARRVESMAGRPQDIEWALDENGLHLLQTRDITVLPVRPEIPNGNNWQKDLAHYPEPMTPFGWSAIALSSEETRGVFDERGLLVRGLEERFVGGEIYGRVLPAFGSADSAGKPPPAIVLGVASRIVPELRRRTATAARAIESNQAQRWTREWFDFDREDMVRRYADLDRVELDALDDGALVEHLEQCTALTRRGTRIHFRLVMPLAEALFALHNLVGENLGWDDSRIAGMLAGHSPATRASEGPLSEMRTRIRSLPGATDALEAEPGDPLGVLVRFDPTLADQLREWCDEHAWAMVNYDAGVPVLAERPKTITQLLLSDPAPIDLSATDNTATEARDALPAGLREEFDRVLRDARAIYPVREDNTVVVGDRPLGLLRRWMLEVADRLTERGQLADRSDAVYLEVDELRDALRARGDLAERSELTQRVLRRRNEEAWVRARPGPAYMGKQAAEPDISRLPRALRQVNEPVMWVIGHEYPAPVDAPEDSDVLVAGVAASGGVAEGPVRIISSHADMDRLQEGDVLVCQVTSPAWAPVFPLATAVVADGGGVLSHAAIAAREHGLPAVLGTANATSTLRDGQAVRVDGTRGLVFTAE